MKKFAGTALAFLIATSLCGSALGFPHIVREGDTLASIAELYYGKLKFERILATENGLDRLAKNSLSPGYPLEVPTLRYHRVASGVAAFIWLKQTASNHGSHPSSALFS
jgi:hypothetical protein